MAYVAGVTDNRASQIPWPGAIFPRPNGLTHHPSPHTHMRPPPPAPWCYRSQNHADRAHPLAVALEFGDFQCHGQSALAGAARGYAPMRR